MSPMYILYTMDQLMIGLAVYDFPIIRIKRLDV